MTPDNKYSEVLLELKTHYQQTLAELEAQTNQIKARLASLDTLIEDPLLGSDILSVLQGEADSLTSTAPASNIAEALEPKAEAQPKKTAPKASPTTSKKSASRAKKKKKKASSTRASSRPMLAPYTDMYKTDAIAAIMQEKAGTSVYIDDLVLRLYGELGGDDLKVERDRVYKAMQSGVQKNRWRKDPKASMSYIFEEKSQAKSKKT